MKRAAFVILTLFNFSLIYILFDSVRTEIQTNEQTQQIESKIKNKLTFIRDLQKIYKSQEGIYASTWDELNQFSNSDSIYVIAVRETYKLNPINQTEVSTQSLDTIRAISVKDSVFNRSIYKPDNLSSIPGYSNQHFL